MMVATQPEFIRLLDPIKRQMKRRAAIEPRIDHAKAPHRMDRSHLERSDGDRIDAV